MRAAFIFFFCSSYFSGDFLFSQQQEFSAPRDFVVINSIFFTGNKTTKDRILLRELTFKQGDTILLKNIDFQLNRSRQNLMNIELFNFVKIDTVPFFQNRVDVHINVTERWYIFPVPLFEIAERNFNTWWQTKNLERASYGMYLTHDNFRGLKQTLMLKFRFGYSQQFGVNYIIPYINKKQNSGLSFSVYSTRVHEVPYQTYGNQLLFYKNPDYFIPKEFSAKTAYTYRKGLYNSHYAELKYVNGHLADTVLHLTADYFPASQSITELFVLSYAFRHDYRDFKPYPLRGHMWGVEVAKLGFGVLPHEKIDIVQIQALVNKYMKLDNRLYFASGLKFKLSSNQKQPYYVQRALGYGDYVRGYEYYVVDGQQYALFKNNIRYQLIKPHVKKLPFHTLEEFETFYYALYLSLFFDSGYVKDNYYYLNNPLTNDWLFGYGAGIDFVTYYDTVVRFEFARNRMNENVFSIRLSAPL